jgi:hypothetical protein
LPGFFLGLSLPAAVGPPVLIPVLGAILYPLSASLLLFRDTLRRLRISRDTELFPLIAVALLLPASLLPASLLSASLLSASLLLFRDALGRPWVPWNTELLSLVAHANSS